MRVRRNGSDRARRRRSGGLLAFGLALVLGLPSVQATGAAAAGTGLRVAGTSLTRGGAAFVPRGFSLIGDLAGAGCSRPEVAAANAHLGAEEMSTLASAWHANTVRLQVSQTALSDPVAADVATYLDQVSTTVAQAHTAGLAVILSVQDQALSCGPSHPLPSQATVTAWTNLVGRFAPDADVAFELFNEPHDAPAKYKFAPGEYPTADQWTEWRDGGTTPESNLGDTAVGFQQLVTTIRGLGATNVLVVDGLNFAGQLQGHPALQDTLVPAQLAYAVHPYYYTLGYTDWDFRFGDAALSAPVIATEWNYALSDCGNPPQAGAPAFLSYLAARGIGVLGQSADIGIGTTVMGDWSWTPSVCPGLAAGPGADLLASDTADAAGRASALSLTAGTGFTVGGSTTVSGTLTVAGVPAPGIPLALSRRNPDGGTTSIGVVTTMASGSFTITDTPVAVGKTVYTATYAGNPTTASATASGTAVTTPVQTFVSVTGPTTATRAAPLTLTGSLVNAPSTPQTLTLTRTDLTGTVTLSPLTTDASGAFVATDTPPAGGTVTYTVGYAGDTTHAGATATVSVAVSRTTPTLTVTANGSVYAYGGAATVTVRLGATWTNRTISLYEYVYGATGATWVLVHTGPVSSAGTYVWTFNAYRHLGLQATYAGDARTAPATATSSLTALARITPTLSGSYGTSGSYRLVHAATSPALRAVLAPARGAVGCVSFTTQAYRSGVWTTVTTSPCTTVDATSGATGHPLATHTVGVLYRVRASIATDMVNSATASAWVYVRFTT